MPSWRCSLHQSLHPIRPNSSYADMHSRLQGKKTDKGGAACLVIWLTTLLYVCMDTLSQILWDETTIHGTGPAEVKRYVEIITPLVKGASKEPTDKRKQIFTERVHIAMDNFFSSNDVLQYLEERGWKAAMTCRCDHLPKSVPTTYLNFI